MVDCNPEIIVFMNHMWKKLNYIPVLNMLITAWDLSFKENQFEGSIIFFLG